MLIPEICITMLSDDIMDIVSPESSVSVINPTIALLISENMCVNISFARDLRVCYQPDNCYNIELRKLCTHEVAVGHMTTCYTPNNRVACLSRKRKWCC